MKKLVLKCCLISFLFLLISRFVFAQSIIGDTLTIINPNAAFEVSSTTKGMLIPRVDLTSRLTGILTKGTGMIVYNTGSNGTFRPGIYQYNGTSWLRVLAGSNSVDSTHILPNSILTSELANNAVTTSKILNGAVTAVKLDQMGATNGSILSWQTGLTPDQWVPTDSLNLGGQQLTVASSAAALSVMTLNASSISNPALTLDRYQPTNTAQNRAVKVNNGLGDINFRGYNGSTFITGATIRALPSSDYFNQTNPRTSFQIHTNTGAGLIRRIEIDGDGDFIFNPSSTSTAESDVTVRGTFALSSDGITQSTGQSSVVFLSGGSNATFAPPAADTCPGRLYIIRSTATTNVTVNNVIDFNALAAANLTITPAQGVMYIISHNNNWYRIN